jgi:hypothetical protein
MTPPLQHRNNDTAARSVLTAASGAPAAVVASLASAKRGAHVLYIDFRFSDFAYFACLVLNILHFIRKIL